MFIPGETEVVHIGAKMTFNRYPGSNSFFFCLGHRFIFLMLCAQVIIKIQLLWPFPLLTSCLTFGKLCGAVVPEFPP